MLNVLILNETSQIQTPLIENIEMWLSEQEKQYVKGVRNENCQAT